MKRHASYAAAAVIGLSLLMGGARFPQTVHAQAVGPLVYQAAGPTVTSIQSTIDAFRAALGDNNGSVPGPLPGGRREINWDGGGSPDTSIVPTPFDFFLVTRGARFSTPGTGFVQATVEGLARTFNNPRYVRFFQAFSPLRLFSTMESNVTFARFFVPGGGEMRATTNAFGAVFSDVDQNDGLDNRFVFDQDGVRRRTKVATSISFFGARGNLLHRAAVPASKGDASLSFFGVVFPTSRVATVRITTGNAPPGPRNSVSLDVVMMDDFIFGEPQMIAGPSSNDEGSETLQDAAASGDN